MAKLLSHRDAHNCATRRVQQGVNEDLALIRFAYTDAVTGVVTAIVTYFGRHQCLGDGLTHVLLLS